MSAGQYDITVEQGATFEETLSITDEDGDPVDLSGMTARAQIRKTYSDPTVIASFVATVETPATDGIVTMKMTAANTALLPVASATGYLKVPTNYVYDLELVDGVTVTRLIEGTCAVSPEVTR